MNKPQTRLAVASPRLALASIGLALSLLSTPGSAQASASCTEKASGLLDPLSMALTPQGRLLVSETGSFAPHSGRISILERDGSRRTLIEGLPSGINDVGETSGPAGLVLRGRTLLVAIGVGDVGVIGRNAAGQPVPGSAIANPNGPSSPLFSSVLAIHFSAAAERSTKGLMLTLADQQALAGGQKVTLSNGGADHVTIERIADFPNHIPRFHPVVANNIQMSNPFGLVAVADQIYVTDGGRNLVWRIDQTSGAVAPLVEFAPIPNPIPGFAPVLDAVPTGIAPFGDQLLVTLFRGVPFPPGVSTVQKVDPAAGTASLFIAGLKTAIDVIPVAAQGNTEFLVLEHTSAGLFFGSPGQVLRFETPSGPSTLVANCLTRPTSMTLDRQTGTLYVSERGGRVVSIATTP